MRSLFLKIFFWFWLAIILLGVAEAVVTPLTYPGSAMAPQHNLIENALTNYGRTAAHRLEAGGNAALVTYRRQVETVTHMRVFVFNELGREISNVAPQRDVPEQVSNLAKRTFLKKDLTVETTDKLALVAPYITSQAGKRYVLIGMMEREMWDKPYFPPPTRFLRLLAVILTAGAVCYWLARNLTAPVVKLRAATRQLASGDLQARVGSAMGKRRDELAELGRDFDLMAERIESLMLSQRRLLGDISHELRSPLARLNVALALAHRHVGALLVSTAHTSAVTNGNTLTNGDVATQSESTGNIALTSDLIRIERETERLNELIGQLLVLARLESGEPRTQSIMVNLDRLVHEVAADADFEARSHNRSVQVLASEECWTCGNPELLRSAVENVVRNAIRYTKENTTVEITLHRKSDSEKSGEECAIINVRDRGDGVPEEALADLFRPFYRVAEARERQSGGAGLGLAITERAVRSHGGRVLAANVPDGGLRIELRLPLSPPGKHRAAMET